MHVLLLILMLFMAQWGWADAGSFKVFFSQEKELQQGQVMSDGRVIEVAGAFLQLRNAAGTWISLHKGAVVSVREGRLRIEQGRVRVLASSSEPAAVEVETLAGRMVLGRGSASAFEVKNAAVSGMVMRGEVRISLTDKNVRLFTKGQGFDVADGRVKGTNSAVVVAGPAPLMRKSFASIEPAAGGQEPVAGQASGGGVDAGKGVSMPESWVVAELMAWKNMIILPRDDVSVPDGSGNAGGETGSPVIPPDNLPETPPENLPDEPDMPEDVVDPAKVVGPAVGRVLMGKVVAFSTTLLGGDGVADIGLGNEENSGAVNFSRDGVVMEQGTAHQAESWRVESLHGDDVAGLGRWIGGHLRSVVYVDTEKSMSLTDLRGDDVGAEKSLHYIWGTPATNIQASGQAVYKMVAATQPTYANASGRVGAAGDAHFDGSMTVDFGRVVTGAVGAFSFDGTVTMTENNEQVAYHLQNVDGIKAPLREQGVSMIDLKVTPSSHDSLACATGCTGRVSVAAFGDQAAYIGAVYAVRSATLAGGLDGAAVFGR